MERFTSRRERRLWILCSIVVVGIYSTLGVASSLSTMLQERGWLSDLFWVGIFAVLLAIVTQGFRVRPGSVELFAGIGVIGVFALLFARLFAPEERSHMIEYSVVALLVYEALLERSKKVQVKSPALLALFITTAIGVLDELIQLFIPSRVFDPIDIVFNTGSAVIAIVGSTIIAWITNMGFSKSLAEKFRNRFRS